MSDIMKPVAGNKMVELRQEINDLRAALKKMDDPGKIAATKKEIGEKETYYNILADKQRMGR